MRLWTAVHHLLPSSQALFLAADLSSSSSPSSSSSHSVHPGNITTRHTSSDQRSMEQVGELFRPGNEERPSECTYACVDVFSPFPSRLCPNRHANHSDRDLIKGGLVSWARPNAGVRIHYISLYHPRDQHLILTHRGSQDDNIKNPSGLLIRFYANCFDRSIPQLVYAEPVSPVGMYWNGTKIEKGNRGILLSNGDSIAYSPISDAFIFRCKESPHKKFSEERQKEMKVSVVACHCNMIIETNKY
ncbi:hypothetical protein VTO42DRAFT_2126 [Malbranchea cinnamomea]